MRNKWAGAASFTAILVFGGAAFAQGAPMQPTTINQYVAPDVSDEDVPVVAPGDEISIACDALSAPSQAADDVRVVLTVSAAPTDVDTMGYKKVLATDEKMLQGAVSVKIPNVPDLENHTVDLNIYVVNATGSQACSAGHLKIADGLKQPAKDKHS
jgi:hypothetical protein